MNKIRSTLQLLKYKRLAWLFLLALCSMFIFRIAHGWAFLKALRKDGIEPDLFEYFSDYLDVTFVPMSFLIFIAAGLIPSIFVLIKQTRTVADKAALSWAGILMSITAIAVYYYLTVSIV